MVLKFKSSNITSGKKVFVTSCCDLKSCDRLTRIERFSFLFHHFLSI